MRKKITIYICIFIIIIIAKGFSQTKTYTNADIDKMKKTSVKSGQSQSQKKINPPKQQVKIKNLPIEKKEIIKPKPFVRYDNKDGKMNLTVIGTPKKSIVKNEKEIKPSEYSLSIKEYILPYQQWTDEYEEYFDVHYGDPSLELSNPTIIAIRSLKSTSFNNVNELYRRGTLYDEGDDGLIYNHLSSHFVVDSNGSVFQTMPLSQKTKGAFGVEHKAITIELTGITVQDFNTNSAQKNALKNLLLMLTEKFGIDLSNIYSITEVAQGKSIVKEYLDEGDSEYPDKYSPKKSNFGPSIPYMNDIRKELKNRQMLEKEIKKGKVKK